MSLQPPEKLRRLREALGVKAKREPGYRFYALYDKVYREDVLAHAWAKSRRKGGGPGVDGQTFKDVEAYGVQRWLAELREELRKELYKPSTEPWHSSVLRAVRVRGTWRAFPGTTATNCFRACLGMTPVREPDDRNGHVRFDERGGGNGAMDHSARSATKDGDRSRRRRSSPPPRLLYDSTSVRKDQGLARATRTGKRRKRRRSQQLTLGLVRVRGDRGQGRKKKKHDYVPHTRRPFVDARHPVHVSTRVVGGLPSLRGRTLWAAVRRGFVFGRLFGLVFGGTKHETEIFRIVHFSVGGRHIHLLCEARDRRALSRGIQGFKIRVAKAINRALGGRRGAVFTDRYHERIITNPTQCRHTLAYVLLNSRHHAFKNAASFPENRVDPCSSATCFDGWTVARPRPWANAPPTDTDGEATVAAPTTWLLRGGWKRGSGTVVGRRALLSPNVIPGLPPGAPPLAVW